MKERKSLVGETSIKYCVAPNDDSQLALNELEVISVGGVIFGFGGSVTTKI
jgi:hypothetical protein